MIMSKRHRRDWVPASLPARAGEAGDATTGAASLSASNYNTIELPPAFNQPLAIPESAAGNPPAEALPSQDNTVYIVTEYSGIPDFAHALSELNGPELHSWQYIPGRARSGPMGGGMAQVIAVFERRKA